MPNFKKITFFLKSEIDKLFKNSFLLIKKKFFEIKKSKYNTELSKFLIIISKKVGNSPYRNYLRRCCKEIFKKLMINGLENKFHYFIIFKKYNKKIYYKDILEAFSLINFSE